MQLAAANLQVDSQRPLFSPKVSEYLSASLSDNSRRAYLSDLNHFLLWGGSIPASPQVVATYLAECADSLALATLVRRLVSIGKAHAVRGYTSPSSSELVRTTLRGIRRTHGSHQRQVTPAIKEDVLAMVDGLVGIKGARDRALLLVGFAGAFRRGELVSLCVEDTEVAKQGLLIHLRFSKTDQFGHGRNIAIPHARGAVCAVQAYQQWLDISGITEGPIFRGVTRKGCISSNALTAQSVALVIKERAKALGFDSDKYAGHSLRAGLITSAAKQGVSSWKIRAQTGHKSDAMLARYIREANLFCDNAAGAVL